MKPLIDDNKLCTLSSLMNQGWLSAFMYFTSFVFIALHSEYMDFKSYVLERNFTFPKKHLNQRFKSCYFGAKKTHSITQIAIDAIVGLDLMIKLVASRSGSRTSMKILTIPPYLRSLNVQIYKFIVVECTNLHIKKNVCSTLQI